LRSRDGWDDVDGETGPVRQCALSRRRLPVDDLVRFVLDPAGTVVPDVRRRLPGRGVWIEAAAETVRKAQARQVFGRAFKRAVTVTGDLAHDIDALLVADCLQSLSMLRKAGLLVTGFAKVDAALREQAVALRIEAADAAEDGRERLDRLAAARFGADAPLPVVDLFDSAQLSLALGRENVIHAVALAGAASDAFAKRSLTLATFRSGRPATADGPAVVAAGQFVLGNAGTDRETVENE